MPLEFLAKLNITQTLNENPQGEVEVTILYGEPFEVVKTIVENIGGRIEDLGYGYAIVNIPATNVVSLAQNNAIQYIEFPKSMILTDQGSNRAACVDKTRNTYSLSGEGIIIGFIDSGIDFTHPGFLNEDGTTRIEYIYDLTQDSSKVYDKATINTALKSQDPYSVVPVEDLTGHGTHVAGIACAGGKIDKRYYGVAPKSSIMMVKTGRGYFSLSTSIMRGLKFLTDKSKELNMPLVVNMSLSTNDGAHDGSSLLELYIATIANHEKVTIIVAAGNEGDAAHHVGGILKRSNDINFEVDAGEIAVFLNLYKSILPAVSIEIIAPTGVSSGEIVIEEGYKEGVISGNRYRVFTTGPKPFDMTGEISVSLYTDAQYIIEGVWKIVLRVLNEYNGIFDVWLPVSEGLNINTKFLQPSIDNTLGIPATVDSVISVGSYNYLTNNISPFSGRGRANMYFEAKPEIVAPGEGITSTIPNRSYDTKSGTSMAAPHVSGICALIMEWGIVKGNDPYLFGNRVKYFLVTGAKRERRDVDYPNTSWVYGEVCAYNSLQQILDVLNVINVSSFRESKMNRQQGRFDTIEEYLNSYANSDEIVGTLVEFANEERFKELNNMPNTEVTTISESYGIVYTPTSNIKNIYPYIFGVVDDINPQIFTLTDETPAEASNALNYHTNPYLSLNGKGVLIGVIDTGIDYLNTEFQKEDDTTRIVRIWDQTLDNIGQEINGLKMGVEYTEEQINQAIALKKSGGDPYSIVATKDTNGHGTMVAGLAAARGKNPDLIGIAPNSSIAVVKLKEAADITLVSAGLTTEGSNRYGYVSILLALRYLTSISSELNMPTVMIIPLGTNYGEHSGRTIVSGVIDRIAGTLGNVVVVGTGNEGDTDTHTEGNIKSSGSTEVIELRVGKNQNTLNFEIWIRQPNSASISVTSPSGEVIDRISPKSGGRRNIKFLYEGTIMSIDIDMPNEATGDERIVIRSIYLKEGIWKFTLYGEYVVDGMYWAWLPQRVLLDSDTRFLKPSQYTTLMLPSTANSVISVGYYNQNNNATVGASGRGYTTDGRIKPDVVAGGINAPIVRPGGSVGVASGSSVATAIVGGICALILQWAVVDRNKPEIYATQVKSYIIRGTRMRGGDVYPNREWGYGIIDMTGILNAMRGNYGENVTSRSYREISYGNDIVDNRYEEFNIGGLFIRKPL